MEMLTVHSAQAEARLDAEFEWAAVSRCPQGVVSAASCSNTSVKWSVAILINFSGPKGPTLQKSPQMGPSNGDV
jgi:hypothetical protein